MSDARAEVARACRVLGTLGLTREPAGHVSVRDGADRLLVKARGRGESGLRYTDQSDVIAVDFAGRKVDGRDDLSVPQEVYIHIGVYKARPDVGSVVHVHPLAATLLTVCGIELLPLVGAFDPMVMRLAARGIPRYPRSVLVSTPELGAQLADTLGDAPACLMTGHGLTSVGADVAEAALTAIKVAELADLNYQARLLGEPSPIAPQDLAAFGGAGSTTKPAMIASTWRYYCQTTGQDKEA
jgi:ribulose-5-phosphate 4-epimerase/fuculose-1-phosphate aldolase